MRPLAAVAFAAALLAPAALVQAAETWTVQRFAAQGFSVEAPVALERQPDQQIEGAGTMQSFLGEAGGLLFIATSTNVADVADIETVTAEQVVDSVMAGSVEGNTLVSQRPSTHPGGAARDFIIRTPEGDLMRNRVVYEHPWIYSSFVGSQTNDPAALESAAANRFLGSVKAAR